MIAGEETKAVENNPDREIDLAAEQFAQAWKASQIKGSISLVAFDDGVQAYARPIEVGRKLAEGVSRQGVSLPLDERSAINHVSCTVRLDPMTQRRDLISFVFIVNEAASGKLALRHVSQVIRKPPPTTETRP
jgi:hypothetical protein